MNFRFRTIFVLAVLMFAGALHSAAEPVRAGHLRAALISESEAITPGHGFWVGLQLQMDEHWHVYWRNPGDAGAPPKITWDLPEGFSAGEIQWPYPKLIPTGPLAGYGYDGEILLPIEITPPDSLSGIDSVTLNAHVYWLICKEECIPGETDLSVTLPVSPARLQLNKTWAPRFAQTRDQLPLTDHGWQVAAAVKNRTVQLRLTPPDWFDSDIGAVHFFPFEKKLIESAAEQKITKTDSSYLLSVQRSSYSITTPQRIGGVLVSSTGWRGPGSERAISFDASVSSTPETPVAVVGSAVTAIWKALLFAFLGGMILNLMPCVLPVLSLKILSFVNRASEGRSSALGHGLIFTLGVLASFWILAGILLAVRAGGSQLGWGFQLQSPGFLVFLISFIFLFGLNLLGIFEIGTGLTAIGGKVQKSSGLFGSFLSGVTATVVATPCTAPFMGSALGFSLTQPYLVSLAIFSFLGLGMAAPYVVLSASPGLLRFVPKPGPWMETFKQLMGFLLLATVIWLIWVLGNQAGANAVILILILLLFLSIAAWVLGRWGKFSNSGRSRTTAYAASVLIIVGGIFAILVGINAFGHAPQAATSEIGGISWQPYSPEKLDSLLTDRKPVFIDFTASWCLSCQVNERIAFSSTEVKRKFDKLHIVPLKADWTLRDEVIGRTLATYGRNSVPLYVLYKPGGDREPIILPEILTPGIVLDALDKIEQSEI